MYGLRLFGWIISTFLIAFCGFTLMHSNGIVHTTKKNGQGCICHGFTPSPSVQVFITGPESLAVGQAALYGLSVVKDTNIAAGFNVATFFGTLRVGDSLEQRLIEEELTHAFPKFSQNSDTISWLFRYEAPEVPFYDTLYAVGNSIDTSFDPSGDFWNFSDNFVIRVGTPTKIHEEPSTVAAYQLFQNYPNPFNPATKIIYSLAKPSHVRLTVFDIHGKQVSLVVEKVQETGLYEIEFDATHLSSGVYFYRFDIDGLSQTKKMVVVK